MRNALGIVASAVVLTAVSATSASALQAQASDEAVAMLGGNWSGTIVVDATRSQDVAWRFETGAPGALSGFMGPAAMGRPTIPMQNITSDGSSLQFTVDSQAGEFIGTLSDGEATGTWRQGQWGAVTLTRAEADVVGDALTGGGAYAAVLGRWEGRMTGSTDESPRMYVEFLLGEDGELSGFAGDDPGNVTAPLSAVSLEGAELSFQPPSQAPAVRRFTGAVSGSSVMGTWFEGVEATLTMRKSAPRD